MRHSSSKLQRWHIEILKGPTDLLRDGLDSGSSFGIAPLLIALSPRNSQQNAKGMSWLEYQCPDAFNTLCITRKFGSWKPIVLLFPEWIPQWLNPTPELINTNIQTTHHFAASGPTAYSELCSTRYSGSQRAQWKSCWRRILHCHVHSNNRNHKRLSQGFEFQFPVPFKWV